MARGQGTAGREGPRGLRQTPAPGMAALRKGGLFRRRASAKHAVLMTATTASAPSAQGTVFTVLFAVALCHGINDTMQAVLLSVYPMLRDNYALTFAQVGLITLVFQVTASILQPFVGIFHRQVSAALFASGRAALHAGGPAAPGACAFLSGDPHCREHDRHRLVDLPSGRLARGAALGRRAFWLCPIDFQVGGNVGTAIGPLLAAMIVLPRGQEAISWLPSSPLPPSCS